MGQVLKWQVSRQPGSALLFKSTNKNMNKVAFMVSGNYWAEGCQLDHITINIGGKLGSLGVHVYLFSVLTIVFICAVPDNEDHISIEP